MKQVIRNSIKKIGETKSSQVGLISAQDMSQGHLDFKGI